MSDFLDRRSFPAIAPNVLELPYPVRRRGWSFWGALAGYAFFLLVSVVVLIAICIDHSASVWMTVFFVAIAAYPAFGLWTLFRPVVVLYPDRIEQRTLLRGLRVLSRTGVRGVSETKYSRGGSYFSILPLSPSEPTIRLNASVRDDPVVAAWLQGAPNPDAEKRAADRAAVLSDPRFGATTAERTTRLEQATPAVTAFTIVFMAAAYAIFFLRSLHPLALVAVVAAPLIAFGLVRWSNGLIVWAGTSKARPQVGIGAVAPAVALGVAALIQHSLYDIWPLTGAAAAVGLGVAGLIYFAGAREAEFNFIVILAGAAAGLGLLGAVVVIDQALDPSKPAVRRVEVLGKHISHGRSTTDYLYLAAWPQHGRGDVEVDDDLYDRVAVGDPVCVSEHPGALALPWFQVGACAGYVRPAAATTSEPAPPSDGLDRFYPERRRG